MPPSPPDFTAEENAHAKEVYAHYGLAMMAAQHLERELVSLLLVFDLAPILADYPRDERPAHFDRLMAALNEKTLGQLVSRVCTAETPQHIAERLGRSNALRVYLAHYFFQKRAKNFLTAKGRTSAIDELRAIRAYLMDTVEMLEAMAQPTLDKMGFTVERVLMAGDEYIAKLREDESNDQADQSVRRGLSPTASLPGSRSVWWPRGHPYRLHRRLIPDDRQAVVGVEMRARRLSSNAASPRSGARSTCHWSLVPA